MTKLDTWLAVLYFLWKMIYTYRSKTCFGRATEDKNRSHLDNLFIHQIEFYVFFITSLGFLTYAVLKFSYKHFLCFYRVTVTTVIGLRVWKKFWKAPICHSSFQFLTSKSVSRSLWKQERTFSISSCSEMNPHKQFSLSVEFMKLRGISNFQCITSCPLSFKQYNKKLYLFGGQGSAI